MHKQDSLVPLGAETQAQQHYILDHVTKVPLT